MRNDDITTRTSLAEALARKAADGWTSDWRRLRTMTEAELEQAIAEDPDSDFAANFYLPIAPDLMVWLEAQPEGAAAALDAVLRKARAAGG